MLRQMKSLRQVRVGTNLYSVADFWKKYDAGEIKP
jgi:hypothetical protein